MDLLNQIIRQPVDPDYASSAARGRQPARGRWTLAVLAMIIGALFAVAALQTTRAAPALQSERTELINRVQNAEREQDELRGRVTCLVSRRSRRCEPRPWAMMTRPVPWRPASMPSTQWSAMSRSAGPEC